MSLKETNNKIKKIKADEETKDAFFELIDSQIEENMEKAMNHMDKSISRLEASIGSLNNRLESSIGALTKVGGIPRLKKELRSFCF